MTTAMERQIRREERRLKEEKKKNCPFCHLDRLKICRRSSRVNPCIDMACDCDVGQRRMGTEHQLGCGILGSRSGAVLQSAEIKKSPWVLAHRGGLILYKNILP